MQYHIGPLRKIQFLMIPALGFVFFMLVLTLAYLNNDKVNPLFVLVDLLMLAGVGLIPWLLYRNYLKYNRDFILTTGDNSFRLSIGGEHFQIPYEDITAIEEYMNTSVSPWYYCEYWIVKTAEKEFLISSLLISRNDFFVRFPVAEKLHRNSVFFPFINK